MRPAMTMAQAIRFQPQGATAAGQGNAFAAQADDASAIHFNPAGLTQVDGVQSIVGSTLMGGSIKYKSPAGLDTRGDLRRQYHLASSKSFLSECQSGIPRRISVLARHCGDRSYFAIWLEHSLSSRWPLQHSRHLCIASAHRYQADCVPIKINDQLSIGVSADIYTFASFLGQGQVEQKQIGVGALEWSFRRTQRYRNRRWRYRELALYTVEKRTTASRLLPSALVYRTQAVVPLSGSLLVNGGEGCRCLYQSRTTTDLYRSHRDLAGPYERAGMELGARRGICRMEF